jgi:NAD(P) transhydrogenase subunit alpha
MLDDDGNIAIDPTDDVFSGLTATTSGDIVNERLREALNLPPLTKPEPATATEAPTESKGAE